MIKVDFLAAVHDFFQKGKILKQINHAAIALIPMTKHQSSAADFRPISCGNVVYKTISKIIASRLGKVLPQIVDEAQVAFVEGRNMADNMFLAQQLVRGYGRTSASPRCVMMADIQKAFDTISWSFIEKNLFGFHFPPKFNAWIMECITSTTYSISYNCSLPGYFVGRRGICQGDPISPYLFVLAMEYLTRMIKVYTGKPGFKYHQKMW